MCLENQASDIAMFDPWTKDVQIRISRPSAKTSFQPKTNLCSNLSFHKWCLVNVVYPGIWIQHSAWFLMYQPKMLDCKKTPSAHKLYVVAIAALRTTVDGILLRAHKLVITFLKGSQPCTGHFYDPLLWAHNAKCWTEMRGNIKQPWLLSVAL